MTTTPTPERAAPFNAPGLLNLSDASKRAGVCVRVLARMIEAGLIPAFRSRMGTALVVESDVRKIAFEDEELVELARQKLERHQSGRSAKDQQENGTTKSQAAAQQREVGESHGQQSRV